MPLKGAASFRLDGAGKGMPVHGGRLPAASPAACARLAEKAAELELGPEPKPWRLDGGRRDGAMAAGKAGQERIRRDAWLETP